jgi:hypothetical protein
LGFVGLRLGLDHTRPERDLIDVDRDVDVTLSTRSAEARGWMRYRVL